ncbi:MAG: enoyl-CoA hydratase [Ectothiorhodospiraceae bacterium]
MAVRVQDAEGIRTITLDRPDKRNALTGAMYGDLRDAVRGADTEPAVRALLIRGAGADFCAGNDLEDFGPEAAARLERGEDLPVMALIDTVLDLEKPLVAAVRGHAVGIGTTLLLHCDVVAASETARFSLPFARLGLAPEFASSYLLPLLAGPVRARHALLLGTPFDREQAREMGMVSLACADADLDNEAVTAAASLAALPPGAVRATKRLVNDHHRQAVRAAVATEAEAFREGLTSAEHQEAVAAFFHKRAPDFSRFK